MCRQLRLVDDKMKDVPIGTPGEALIKAPVVFMCVLHDGVWRKLFPRLTIDRRHYRNNPQATKESFHDGWLRTGDSLTIDKDGHLWFHDRKKEMIKYKGYAGKGFFLLECGAFANVH
jgi:4-coumarate--CoA ligase